MILAGGSGTRLWPLSREHYPKQLIDVIGTHSLLQDTVRRMDGFPAQWTVRPAPIIVCGDEHRFVTAEQLRESGVTAHLVVEPARRDTAPALTLAAALAVRDGEDAILVAMPADHAMLDTARFSKPSRVPREHAQRGAIATLGVPPTRPDTGVRLYPPRRRDRPDAYRIDRFVEKPALELAAQYVASGAYWWNSGIFVVRASVWLELVERLQPAMAEACLRRGCRAARRDGPFFRPQAEAFGKAPSDSIDYAVMERLGIAGPDGEPFEGVVVPLVAGWSDLGSWDAVWDALEKDAAGNVGRGRVLFEGATLVAMRIRKGGWSPASARAMWWSSKRPMPCWWPTARTCRTSRGWWRASRHNMRPKRTSIARCAAHGAFTIRSTTANASR